MSELVEDFHYLRFQTEMYTSSSFVLHCCCLDYLTHVFQSRQVIVGHVYTSGRVSWVSFRIRVSVRTGVP